MVKKALNVLRVSFRPQPEQTPDTAQNPKQTRQHGPEYHQADTRQGKHQSAQKNSCLGRTIPIQRHHWKDLSLSSDPRVVSVLAAMRF
jgi:hypothetical protein